MNAKHLRYVILAIGCIFQAVANAQGTLFLSHLGSSANTGVGVYSDRWWAVSFETGTNAGGYDLASIQLRMAGTGGNPTGFELLLYNNDGGLPGGSLDPLGGSDPTGAGVYTFTASGMTLSPSTVYWAVTTSSDSSLSGNSFYWAFDPNNDTSSDGWSLGSDAASFNGSSWSGNATSPFTLAVNATSVPEPETYSLTGLGLLTILLRRRKQRQDCDNRDA